VTPVPLAEPGAKAPSRVLIAGRGQTKAPRPGQTAEPGVFPPRWASLKSLADADCERRWKRSATKYSNRFVAASALCAVDADGRAPFSSVCNGDSGGPMVSGTLARPLLVGVISWTGPRCGADKLPSVSAEVAHFHSFLTDTDPVWAPVPGGPAKVTGDPRVGATLRCEIPAWEVAPDKLEIRWLRRVRTKAGYEFRNVGSAETYKAVPADSGNLIDCQARGSNAGGEAETPPAASAVRIAGQAGAEAGAAVSRATSAA
jgi:hypothetical protein